MKLIYVHLDSTSFNFSNQLDVSNFTFSDLPDYAQTSIEQSKAFGYDVEVITDTTKYNSDIDEFFEVCKKGFPSYYKDPFWLLTLLRLYVLYLYVKDRGIDNFIHMEYDNLIYHEPDNLLTLPNGIYFTQLGAQCGSAGIVFCNSVEHFGKFISNIKQLLTKGESVVQQFTSYDQLTEMIMIDLIKQHTNDIEYLPILPWDKFYDQLQMLYDGAPYGQFIGGTNCGHEPGFYAPHQFTGQAIYKQQIKVEFDKKPYVLYNDKVIPIFNLHIHSKELDKWK